MLSGNLPNASHILTQLRDLQRQIRQAIIQNHVASDNASVKHVTSADTIYGIDAVIEPVIEAFMEEWGKTLSIVLVAEGIEPETGRIFPAGAREEDCRIRVILDPIDGTRGIMYDKRAAWSLAGVARNRGKLTKLSDIEIAVMTELPTSKMGYGDVLWAFKGSGAHAIREKLDGSGLSAPLLIQPSTAETIDHGFATISNFFPGTKVLASECMEAIARELIGPADVTRATVFEDQYICTGGQFYELIVGHDRFNADLRPLFYKLQNQPVGLCCHPYDCCTALIAEEAGVQITDGRGNKLDGPLDVVTGLSWAGFANANLRRTIEPLLLNFLSTQKRPESRRPITGE